MRIALVHDWFTTVGGAEHVLVHMHRLWPDAPIYMLVADGDALRRWLPDAHIVLSPLQRVPWASRLVRWLLWMMPSAVEAFDFSEYDVVISSSVLFSKGIVVRPGTRHYCYCYSPSRPLWDRAHTAQYSGRLAALFFHCLRLWDSAAAHRPDQFIAPSQAVQDRIRKWYRADAVVIPPPARLGTPSHVRKPYFLVVGRLTPHKNLDVLLEAFAKLRDELVIVGDGPMLAWLRRHAPPNVRITGYASAEDLDAWYTECTGVIVAAEEDWGLTAVEAMSYGKPVLALRAGGVLETVVEGVTGEFFDDPIPEAVADGMKRLRQLALRSDPETLARHAQKFGGSQFEQRMRTLLSTP